MKNYGVYIHAPWCKRHCPYCAFNVIVDPDARYEDWCKLVQRDWNRERSHFEGPAQTIYFGGGTPSLIPIEHISEILLSIPQVKDTERTLEANPGDLSLEQLRNLKSLGINRLSLGVQTFQEQFARVLGRGTSIALAEKMLRQVKETGFDSWSIDLMFGLPEQQMSDLESDLSILLQHRPPHVSLYGLTYEPGTPFERAKQKGRLKEPNEDLWTDQLDLILSTLSENGYQRYEVSNFALPGHRSRHNESIWRNQHYAGLGPGAHGFRQDGTRTIQPSTLADWQTSTSAVLEHPSELQAATDAVITWIRHIDGISIYELTQMGYSIETNMLEQLRVWKALKITAEHIVLAEHGWNIVDSITARLVQALSPLRGKEK